jgi:imidazole glycerol-phosphate synthase subunit HisF
MAVRPRLVPLLLVRNGGLVKSVGFKEMTYLGDPLNAVRIFNEKQADELIVFDIDRTLLGQEPDYEFIRTLCAQCEMPLSYGGGVTSADQVKRLIRLGLEKVSLGSSAVLNNSLISAAASEVGSQSVIVTIDVSVVDGKYTVFVKNGTVNTGRQAQEFASECQAQGAGEIVVNSIDRDGSMAGYDIELAKLIADAVTVPCSFAGGAGSLRDFELLYDAVGTCGAIAGSFFVYKGPLRAVLISYPNRVLKEKLRRKSSIS